MYDEEHFCRYKLIQGTYELDGQTYVSYGISVFSSGEEKCFCDLCSDYGKISQLVELCNSLKLDPLHLEDVIEDCLF